jgi:hypothetical protein
LTLDELYAPFADKSDKPNIEPISAGSMPEPYRSLLVHTHHMTVTVERFYGNAVDVIVLDTHQTGDFYSRKILLSLRGSGVVVQFGIVQIDFSCLDIAVRDEIVSQKTPLGRVLIQHNVLRTVQPVDYFRATLSQTMCQWFGLNQPQHTYGRLGVIYTNNKPAIRVAEIMAPVQRDASHTA